MRKKIVTNLLTVLLGSMIAFTMTGCTVEKTYSVTHEDGSTTTTETTTDEKGNTTTTESITDENGNTTTTETVNGQETSYYENVPMLVANELGGDIAEVYICLSDAEDWGNNLVPEGELFPNDRTLNGLNLTYAKEATINVLVVDEAGGELEFDDIDLSPADGKAFAIILGYDEADESFYAYIEQQ